MPAFASTTWAITPDPSKPGVPAVGTDEPIPPPVFRRRHPAADAANLAARAAQPHAAPPDPGLNPVIPVAVVPVAAPAAPTSPADNITISRAQLRDELKNLVDERQQHTKP